LPTDFQFTGQRIQSKIALYDYHARFYDPYVGRFIQADTIVPSPGNPQHFNRYSYVLNNPLAFTDPGGHRECGPACEGDVTGKNLDPCLGSDCFGVWGSGNEWGRGWTAHDTGVVAWTLVSLVGWAVGAEVVAAAGSELGPTLLGYLGIGETARELVCADGNCTNEAEASLQALQHFLETGEGNLQEILTHLENLGVTVEEATEYLGAMDRGAQYTWSTQIGQAGTLLYSKITDLGQLGHEAVHFLQHQFGGFSSHVGELEVILYELEAYWWQLDHAEALGYSLEWEVPAIEEQIIGLMHDLSELLGTNF
jgi:RHS repeat-associated protein